MAGETSLRLPCQYRNKVHLIILVITPYLHWLTKGTAWYESMGLMDITGAVHQEEARSSYFEPQAERIHHGNEVISSVQKISLLRAYSKVYI